MTGSVELSGLRLSNPLMLASGTWGFGETLSPEILRSVGALVTKGISLEPRAGNPPPRLSETPCGLLNSIGLENPGLAAFRKGILPRLLRIGPPVIVNILGESEEEFLRLAEGLRETGVAGLEVNISCPNVKKGGLAFSQDPDGVFRMVRRLREVWPGWMSVKLSPVGPVAEVAHAAEEGGASALTCANTYPALAIHPGPKGPYFHLGGLSGPAIKPLTLRLVYELSRRLRRPLIACGGILSGRDAYEYLLAGARAFQVGTATLLDPEAPRRILSELDELSRAD
ncbi:dihydroorotate dehydrogenase [Thermosulfurimonas marina]|uniref:Dihydroorotate dehydrogenase n=1 Tax=Thermosulfurimonas marina TaxID=2047767 RepID=A0A6H1WS64_9BACT|nr:dihydroorotate dehydrogenase [Thermosulfurimonas marina]QJA06021.1 dihydroorotate dehydrogenase [Thermosulfurimonas marina]